MPAFPLVRALQFVPPVPVAPPADPAPKDPSA
ncbi:hypothetical protein FALB51S_00276 [Frigidibacter albus]|uniref:Uncharacterized protein n=1 Tax=Frigidibacter mobilis TaxID=1335048 RepID=A0A165STQ7_9RHOB|nr:hypothetical protein AKL17_3767 [Frigidibacter mobilis]